MDEEERHKKDKENDPSSKALSSLVLSTTLPVARPMKQDMKFSKEPNVSKS